MPPALLVVLSLALAPPAPAQAPDAKPKPRAAPTPAPVLEGTVRSADGRPLEKALVITQPLQPAFGEMPLTARTDAAGRFRLPLRTGATRRLRVEATGWAAVALDKVRPGAALAITLHKGVAIDGTVRDAGTGAPVPGAIVETRDERTRVMPVWEPGAGHVAATADAEGRFRVEGLAEGLHRVSARARGYGRGERSSVPTGTRVELYLLPGSSLSGAVRDGHGRPVAGAAVRVDGERTRVPGGSTVATDAEGRFEVTGLAAGEHRVTARHPSYPPAWVGGVLLDRGADATIDVVLHGGSPVTGRLVAGDEQPVAGRIALQETDERPVPWGLDDVLGAEAGPDGRFRLTLPPGAHALSVLAPGYAARRVEVDVGTGGSPLDLGDVALESGLVIRGRVRDETGAPVADAQVFGSPIRGMGPGGGAFSHGQARTEADGTFVIAGLRPGTQRVSAGAPGFAEAVQAVEAGGTVDFVLDRTGAIGGRVVDEAGRPIESFRVFARPVREPGPMGGISMRGDTFTAADGQFRLEDVPDGTWVVEASAPDRADGVVSGVVVAAGATADVGRVRLGPGGIVRGLVVEADGAPVGGASVNLHGAGRDHFSPGTGSVSDPGGAFELRGVEGGTVELVATHPSYAEGRVSGLEVDPALGPAETRIVMAQGGRIEGRLARRDGSGLAGTVHVSPMNPGGRRAFTPGLSAQAGPDGTFAIEHVPAGRVTLFVMAGGGGIMESRQSREVEVREGDTTTVEFLSREILVTGHVSRGGAPGPGLRLRLLSQGGSRMMMSAGAFGAAPAPPSGPQRLTGVTDESGSFALIVDEPGTYGVLASTVDGQTTFPMRTIEIPDADSHVADLAFGGIPVTGMVVDRDTEEPVPAAMVMASPRAPAAGGRGAGGGSATAAADGRFALELDPGDYRIQTQADGYAPDTTELAVAEGGPTTELRLTLSRGGSITGRVVDAAGRVVAGVRVAAITDEGEGGSGGGWAESLPGGSFEMRGLGPGSYTLSAQSNLGAFAVRGGVPAGQTGVTLTLRPGGSVQVQVYGPDGAPVERAFVRVSRVAGVRAPMMGGATTSPAGTAQIVAPEGDVELEVGKDKLRGRVTVSVMAGAAAAAEVVLAETDGQAAR